jgi:hypothetical protein
MLRVVLHFLFPHALWALCLSGVFYWLCRQQSCQVFPVANLELWKECVGSQPVGSLRRIHLPLFVAQILAYSLLVIACAYPVYTVTGREVIVVLDTSASMASRDAQGTVFLHSIRRLRNWLTRLSATDRVILYTYPPLQKYESEARAFPPLLDTIEPSQLAADWTSCFALLRQTHSLPMPIFWLTDGAGSAHKNFPGVIKEAHGCLATDNVAIDAFTIEPSETGHQRLFLALRNFSRQKVIVPLAIQSDHVTIHQQNVTLAAGERRCLSQLLEPLSCSLLRAEILRSDNLSLDNSVSASHIPPLAVWLSPEAPQPLQRLLDVVPGVVRAASPTQSDMAFTAFDDQAQEQGWLIHSRHFSPAVLRRKVTQPISGMIPAADELWRAVCPELLAMAQASPLAEPLPVSTQPLLCSAQGMVMAYGQEWLYCGFNLAYTNWPQLPSFPIFWCNFFDHIAPQRNHFAYTLTQQSYPQVGFRRNTQGTEVAVNFMDAAESDNQGEISTGIHWPPPAGTAYRQTPMLPWLVMMLAVVLAWLWTRDARVSNRFQRSEKGK